MAIRNLRDTEREMFRRAKERLREGAVKAGRPYAECKCGLLILSPKCTHCPDCGLGLEVVENNAA